MLPNGRNVAALIINDQPVDFEDAGPTIPCRRSTTWQPVRATTRRRRDAVAAGVRIVADTQFYVRDAVINYVMDQEECVSPAN